MDMILPSFVVINSYFDGLSSPSNCKLDNSMFPKKMFLKLLQNLKEKTRASGLQFYYKTDSSTDVFLWILRVFSENRFHGTFSGDCLWNEHLPLLSVCVEWTSSLTAGSDPSGKKIFVLIMECSFVLVLWEM